MDLPDGGQGITQFNDDPVSNRVSETPDQAGVSLYAVRPATAQLSLIAANKG